MSDKNRVAITGIGFVCPVGNNVKDSWQSLIEGRSGLSSLAGFSDKDYPWKSFGLVKNEQNLIDSFLSAKEQRKMDRFIQLALVAGFEAVSDAGLSINFPTNRDRFGVFLGVGIGGMGSILQGQEDLQKKGRNAISPFLIPKSISNEAASWFSIKWDLQGQVCTIVNACSSSNDAIGLAFRNIRDGYSDYILAGGSENCITPLSIVSFGNMRALSTWDKDPAQASRPFDKKRSGFVMAEGAAVLVLERYDLAVKRGAKIYAEVLGYGAAGDAYHVTAMHPQGRGAEKAVRLALRDGGIALEQIGYINAHGTGTPMNDPIETQVLKNVFGSSIDPDNEKRILVSSTKSMTGHLLGAAGALEVGITALALKGQILPPTANLDEQDEKCDLDCIANRARRAEVEYAISNSFGFGGANSVILLKRSI